MDIELLLYFIKIQTRAYKLKSDQYILIVHIYTNISNRMNNNKIFTL